ncbi:MAG: molybdopterin oxidoreductase [Candidatus Abyssobacteria bacterium SURF_5]|uniref:Molybdopterin oxidoreductase n=1 Tax=Abyssobacteria bacterium (strain SURF_5) TaxID=2093360 RepID=A0A3A4P7N2_ABYX5|nr:MAG: molybdopterin oxidoreductase [Candidatus Abyssubacteria bacterium SURF_5]
MTTKGSEAGNGFGRREFIKKASALGFAGYLAQFPWLFVEAAQSPLEAYPNRDWEKVYRDLFKPDSTFTFLCAPNDTHNCLLTAHVKNDVIVRIGATYGYGKAEDLYGNKASARWDPRCCQKGLALTRRFYGDRRVKAPMVRTGFREWVEKGFPRDPVTGKPPVEYFNRARDTWEKIPWEKAADLAARTLINVAQTYSGEAGAKRLRAQGYDEEMIEVTRGAGTQCLKFRGGMPLLGMTRVFGMYRFANSLALLDRHIRGVSEDDALGGRGWDNYSWHTDLPPGHPMVTGQQTVEFDLDSTEQADLVIVWGMNWITTKMPDAHWLTEARVKGTRVVVIACEYSATVNKADVGIMVRPGTTPALALALSNVIVQEKLFDEKYVKRFTDLPLLVRYDNMKLLHASDIFKDYQNADLKNMARVVRPDDKKIPPHKQVEQLIPAEMRDEWGDFVVWDTKKKAPAAITRDQVGNHFDDSGLSPALEGEFEVTLTNDETVRAATIFTVIKNYLADNYSPENGEQITWAPKDAIVSLAREIAAHPGKTLMAIGMGPNQFFNNDLKDRAVFLLAALTGNVGRIAGNVGSYAGNYRVALFNGLAQYVNENPFDIELDPAKPARPKVYWRAESAHYYNHEDHPLKVGGKLFTGKTHMPAPTKTLWFANANSILGNVKWHYNVVHNVLPKFEMIAVNEWWWSTSCEHADIVFAADSWAETKNPDMCASVTNPFLTLYPETPIARIHDSRGDIEIIAMVGKRIGELIDDPRFSLYWKFADEQKSGVYLQRILDHSSNTAGYSFADLHEKAKKGVPALMMSRTMPKCVGFEQTEESVPWYTKTGRLEFYRDEPEFIEHGENLPVHREPIDSTFYEPNAILAAAHPLIRPLTPQDYGLDPGDQSGEVRQVRNVVKPWSELSQTQHPLMSQGYRFIFHTPKYRHGAHTTPIDTDMVAILFGPFGDIYRRDKRMPFVSEGYVDINPQDARKLGIEDGDYVWIDADPADRPYRGWKPDDPDYKVSRLLCRARYYPGTPLGVTRMWFNMYAATPGSVKGQETREDGLAKNPETNYQAMFRTGSHQSATRGWLKPTHMTDSLVRKDVAGQNIGKGFLPDVHCPTGAPRESFVKIEKAEPGGINGSALWQPAALGIRPTYESESFKRYLSGAYIVKRSQ